jgi:hypothetical protein
VILQPVPPDGELQHPQIIHTERGYTITLCDMSCSGQ